MRAVKEGSAAHRWWVRHAGTRRTDTGNQYAGGREDEDAGRVLRCSCLGFLGGTPSRRSPRHLEEPEMVGRGGTPGQLRFSDGYHVQSISRVLASGSGLPGGWFEGAAWDLLWDYCVR